MTTYRFTATPGLDATIRDHAIIELRKHFGHVIDALPYSGRLALADVVIANAKRDGTTLATEIRALDRSIPKYLSLFDYVATLPWETDR